MKRMAAAFIVLTALAGPLTAQTAPAPDALAAAQELAAVMNGDSMTQMRAAITAQLWTAVERQLGPRADAAALTEMRSEFDRSVAELTGDVMKDVPAVYARHFTAQELRDMIAFYKSPTGAKSMKEMPALLTEVSQQIAPRMQRMQTDLNARTDTIMRNHGYGK
jgi:hypothetical protein